VEIIAVGDRLVVDGGHGGLDRAALRLADDVDELRRWGWGGSAGVALGNAGHYVLVVRVVVLTAVWAFVHIIIYIGIYLVIAQAIRAVVRRIAAVRPERLPGVVLERGAEDIVTPPLGSCRFPNV